MNANIRTRGWGDSGTQKTVKRLNLVIKNRQINKLRLTTYFSLHTIKMSVNNLAIVQEATKNGNLRCKLTG